MSPPTPSLVLVVAAADNDVIGHRGGMPWHLPADLAYFRRVTASDPLLLGRATHDAIGRALPGRRNVVLSRRAGWTAPGCEVVSSLPEALEALGAARACVIGGAEVFSQTEHLAHELHLTRVHARPDGDTLLPLDLARWRLRTCERRPADEQNAFDCTFSVYDRA